MRPSKPLLSLAAIFASLMLLAGCGGGGESDSTQATSASGEASTTTSTSGASAAQGAKSAGKQASAKSAKDGSGAKQGAGSGVPKPSGAAPTDPSPLPNEGTSAPAPGVPTTKGGDNSIQEYGLEAASSERIEAAQIVASYLGAQASGEWSSACAYLWAPVREKLELLGKQASPPGGCEVAMEKLLSTKSNAELDTLAQVQVLSMRTQGNRAFVIFEDADGEPFNLPLIEEGGKWKITTLAPIAMVI